MTGDYDPYWIVDESGRPLGCDWCGAGFETWEDREYHVDSRHPLAGRDEVGT